MSGTISAAVTARVKAAFARLNRQSAEQSFPKPVALANALSPLVPNTRTGAVQIDARIAGMFATAAVNIWLRAIHSFVISAALTKASPIWGSVAGYYSSHYSVRGIAHLLGVFSLYGKKAIAQLNVHGAHLVCEFSRKGAGEGEHKFYWKVVRSDPYFANDPLFPLNDDNAVVSDAAHRGRANYSDHIRDIPVFQPLTELEITDRIERIAEMLDFNAPPIPSCEKFPDVTAVQIVAYQRIIRFRQFVDEILGTTNRFWDVQRDPPWVRHMMDFQIMEQSGFNASSNL